MTDESKLERVNINLVQNAIKLTEAGGVLLDLSEAGDGARFLVKLPVRKK